MRHNQPERLSFRLEDYHEIASRFDESSLRAAYVGRWATREAFGQHLLADTGAEQRIAELPRWLRSFVRIDADAFVSDLEAEGVYVLALGRPGFTSSTPRSFDRRSFTSRAGCCENYCPTCGTNGV